MRLLLLTSGLLLSLTTFAACGQTSEDANDGTDGAVETPATSSAGKDAACADTCELLAECDASLDVEECTASCAKDDSISRGAQEAILECLGELGCEQAQSADALTCLLAAIADVPPSAAGETFCNESLARWDECSAETQPTGAAGAPAELPDADTCLLSISAGSDELLTDLNECLAADKSCQSAQFCVGLQVAPYVQAAQNPQPGTVDFVQLLGALLGGSRPIPGAPDDPAPGQGGASGN
ncbi:MAG TPA: hypothetical protein VLC09_17825 [Polyangiaceae bacterium]|nr:hypothetical protein [Polyangiaceae bacterium]